MEEDKIVSMKDLIQQLNEATIAYNTGNPYMSDKEWDDLYFQLENLEKETGIIYPNSPTQNIYFKTASELPKVIHQYKPMLSLDKTKDPKMVESKMFASQDYFNWCAMFKMDGLSCRLTYVNGKLIRAETRGNGLEGEDITHNAKMLSNIPLVIPTKEEIIVIDGEVICDIDTFNNNFANKYENPRNFAAGSIRLLSSQECKKRHLSFVAWDLIKGCEDIDFFMWRLEKLDDWGFDTVPRIGDAESVKDAINFLDTMKNMTIYPIDGYVFRFESQKYYDSLGQTAHHFNGALAYKFYDEAVESRLKYIDYDVSRNGILTPVAVFEPIRLEGATVERASLHNISVMEEVLGKTPYAGERVWVVKSNQIIPQIKKADKRDYGEIISNGGVTVGLGGDYGVLCPICGHSTSVIISDSGVKTLVCDNPECEGKLVQRIDHYCSKKGLDIKGLSRKTIEKLIDWGWLKSIKDLYKLHSHQMEWMSQPGFGKASVFKILDAIDESRENVNLSAFISALGIPLVGKTIAKEIVKYYDSWEDFRDAVGNDWTEFEGFGPEISKAINQFDYSEADEIVTEFLNFKQIKTQSKETSNAAAIGLTFCVTGRLSKEYWKNRNELKSYIESIGGKVVDHISSKVNYLINNDFTSTSSKNQAAKKNNIPIITEEQFVDKWYPLGKIEK